MVQRRVGGKIVGGEALGREDASAMHRVADAIVFLTCKRPQALRGKTRGHEQSTRAPAHYEDVYRVTHVIAAL